MLSVLGELAETVGAPAEVVIVGGCGRASLDRRSSVRRKAETKTMDKYKER
jgi:hypothetical protein